MVSIIIFILILTFLIVIHELGHFFAARRFFVHIEEFGIGLPPKAKTLFTWKGIPFTLNWLPIGGFVRMEGENGFADANPNDQVSISNDQQNVLESKQSTVHSVQKGKAAAVTEKVYPFYTRPAWQRLIIVLAGVTVNFLYGIIAFALMYSVMGIPTKLPTPRISYIAPNSPAASVGLAVDDSVRFIQVGEKREPIETTAEFVEVVRQNRGTEITLGITRDGQDQDVTVRVRRDDEIPAGEGALGVAVSSEKLVKYPWYETPGRAVVVGFRESIAFGQQILQALGGMVSGIFTRGEVPSDVAGPVGIAYQVQKEEIFSYGPLAVLNFSAILSVNLAIMNLLPIPALDGGRAVFILIERLFSKKRRGTIENALNSVGMAFLLLLLLLITVKDVLSILF